MKIATYNIWNDERGWPDRLDQIYNEIVKQKSDIICLQDVPSEENCKILAENGADSLQITKFSHDIHFFSLGLHIDLLVLFVYTTRFSSVQPFD